MTASEREELLTFDELERRPGLPPELRRRARRALDKAQEVRIGTFVVERRTSTLVALRREPAEDAVPRWRRLADEARADLRRAAVRGDRRARVALADLGELVAPRPWNEAGERDEES